MTAICSDRAPLHPLRRRVLFEKVLARHALATAETGPAIEPGAGGFVRADLRFIHDVYAGMARHLPREAFGADRRLADPAAILAFEDRFS